MDNSFFLQMEPSLAVSFSTVRPMFNITVLLFRELQERGKEETILRLTSEFLGGKTHVGQFCRSFLALLKCTPGKLPRATSSGEESQACRAGFRGLCAMLCFVSFWFRARRRSAA